MLAEASALATPAKPPKPRGAKIVLGLGAILLVIGVLGGRAGIADIRGRITEIRNTGDDLRNGLLIEMPVPGEDGVDLEPGNYDVFALSAFGAGFRRPPATTSTTGLADPDPSGTTTSPAAFEKPEVTITDPAGDPVRLGEPGIEALFGGASGEMLAIHSFTVTTPGTYRIRADGGDAARVGIGPSLTSDLITNVVKTGLFTLLAFLGGGLGVIFVIWGGIWWLVGGKPKPPPPTWGPMPRPGYASVPYGAAPTGAWRPPPPPPPPAPSPTVDPTVPFGSPGASPPGQEARPWGSAPPTAD